MFKCERCGEKTAKGEMCSYCGRIACYGCTKAIKKVSLNRIKKIHICKDCWGKSAFKKMYKNNTPKVTPST